MKKQKLFKKTVGNVGKKFQKTRPYDSKDWIEYRNKFMSHNRFCYACPEKARIVDHLVPWKTSPEELFLKKVDNFIPLCKKCHDYCTANFDRYEIPKTQDKLQWLADSRVTNGITRSVKVVPIV